MLCAGFGILGIGGASLLMLWLASALLRAGVGLANRAIGPVKADSVIAYGDWDSDDDDDEIVVKENEPAIPEPGIGRGMVVMFLASLAQVVIAFGLSVILDGPLRLQDWSEQIAGYILHAASGFVVLVGLLSWMLPTQPKWAALATLFMYLVGIAIAVLIYGLLSVVHL